MASALRRESCVLRLKPATLFLLLSAFDFFRLARIAGGMISLHDARFFKLFTWCSEGSRLGAFLHFMDQSQRHGTLEWLTLGLPECLFKHQVAN